MHLLTRATESNSGQKKNAPLRDGQWWHYDTAHDNVEWSLDRSLERSLLQTKLGAHGRDGRGNCCRIQIGNRRNTLFFRWHLAVAIATEQISFAKPDWLFKQ